AGWLVVHIAGVVGVEARVDEHEGAGEGRGPCRICKHSAKGLRRTRTGSGAERTSGRSSARHGPGAGRLKTSGGRCGIREKIDGLASRKRRLKGQRDIQ